MGNILAGKGERKKSFTEQDWKTGIPSRDGWNILEGEVSVKTPNAKVAPSQIKPSIFLQPKDEQQNPAASVETKENEANDQGVDANLTVAKGGEESETSNEGDGQEGTAETKGTDDTAGNVAKTSKDYQVTEVVKMIEAIESPEQLSNFVKDDSRVTVINAFAKQTKKLNGNG